MYEVFTNASHLPYQQLRNNEVVGAVMAGKRLPRPENCPEEAYALMRKCWATNALVRPTWSTIIDEILCFKKAMELPENQMLESESSFHAANSRDANSAGSGNRRMFHSGGDIDMSGGHSDGIVISSNESKIQNNHTAVGSSGSNDREEVKVSGEKRLSAVSQHSDVPKATPSLVAIETGETTLESPRGPNCGIYANDHASPATPLDVLSSADRMARKIESRASNGSMSSTNNISPYEDDIMRGGPPRADTSGLSHADDSAEFSAHLSRRSIGTRSSGGEITEDDRENSNKESRKGSEGTLQRQSTTNNALPIPPRGRMINGSGIAPRMSSRHSKGNDAVATQRESKSWWLPRRNTNDSNHRNSQSSTRPRVDISERMMLMSTPIVKAAPPIAVAAASVAAPELAFPQPAPRTSLSSNAKNIDAGDYVELLGWGQKGTSNVREENTSESSGCHDTDGYAAGSSGMSDNEEKNAVSHDDSRYATPPVVLASIPMGEAGLEAAGVTMVSMPVTARDSLGKDGSLDDSNTAGYGSGGAARRRSRRREMSSSGPSKSNLSPILTTVIDWNKLVDSRMSILEGSSSASADGKMVLEQSVPDASGSSKIDSSASATTESLLASLSMPQPMCLSEDLASPPPSAMHLLQMGKKTSSFVLPLGEAPLTSKEPRTQINNAESPHTSTSLPFNRTAEDSNVAKTVSDSYAATALTIDASEEVRPPRPPHRRSIVTFRIDPDQERISSIETMHEPSKVEEVYSRQRSAYPSHRRSSVTFKLEPDVEIIDNIQKMHELPQVGGLLNQLGEAHNAHEYDRRIGCKADGDGFSDGVLAETALDDSDRQSSVWRATVSPSTPEPSGLPRLKTAGGSDSSSTSRTALNLTSGHSEPPWPERENQAIDDEISPMQSDKAQGCERKEETSRIFKLPRTDLVCEESREEESSVARAMFDLVRNALTVQTPQTAPGIKYAVSSADSLVSPMHSSTTVSLSQSSPSTVASAVLQTRPSLDLFIAPRLQSQGAPVASAPWMNLDRSNMDDSYHPSDELLPWTPGIGGGQDGLELGELGDIHREEGLEEVHDRHSGDEAVSERESGDEDGSGMQDMVGHFLC